MSNGSDIFQSTRPRDPRYAESGSSGQRGEMALLREQVKTAFAPLVAGTRDEWTNPPAADVDAFALAAATSTSAVELTGDDLDGVVGDAALTYPRPPTVTASNSAPSYAGSVIFEGYDVDGNLITTTVAIANNATATAPKCLVQITSISIPAQNDTSGSLSFGFGAGLGLSKSVATVAGWLAVTREVMDGAPIDPITGTVTGPATNGPHGMYVPAAAPNAAHDYGLWYEYTPEA